MRSQCSFNKQFLFLFTHGHRQINVVLCASYVGVEGQRIGLSTWKSHLSAGRNMTVHPVGFTFGSRQHQLHIKDLF